MSDKPKFPREVALQVAKELCDLLKPACLPDRLKVCGSLRRKREYVSDVEIVYVSESFRERTGLFDGDSTDTFAVDAVFDRLLAKGIIEKRENSRGAVTWGPKNKLGRHVASGVPVDFFAATEGNWWNLVVCRTGSAENNIRIAAAAQQKGLKWHPYGNGFTDDRGREMPVTSEEDVFRVVGHHYLQPNER